MTLGLFRCSRLQTQATRELRTNTEKHLQNSCMPVWSLRLLDYIHNNNKKIFWDKKREWGDPDIPKCSGLVNLAEWTVNQGPEFLTHPVSNWPKQPLDVVCDDILECRSSTFCGVISSSHTDIPEITQYNSLQDLIKDTAVSLLRVADKSKLCWRLFTSWRGTSETCSNWKVPRRNSPTLVRETCI